MLNAQHRAIQREAQLAAEQIGQGVTSLGKANHAQTGLYSQAFFGLSIGLERMGKLIFLADYAITNNGKFPADKDLRRFKHDLSLILPKCEAIGNELDSERTYKDRPSESIHRGIEDVLSLFGTRLRYYNLSHLAGAAEDQQDPIALWWERVATPICKLHYTKRQREKDEAGAAIIEHMIDDKAFVLHTAEDGKSIIDISTLVARGGATRIVQKYGRMYTLQIVRWLASIVFELSHTGAYGHQIEALLGLHEPFSIFLNEDRDLRNWKTWSIYH